MSKKLVFVDDSRSILKTIEILLRQKVQSGSIEMVTFTKPLEFIQAIETGLTFDCLFLDINMPLLSGFDVIQKVRSFSIFSKVPIIALTTENSIEAQEKGRNAGFNDWIIKINASTTFLKSIHVILERFFPGYEQEDKPKIINSMKENPFQEINRLFTIIEDLNKKLIIAEENKSRFLSLIHNEFNNPLLSVTMLMRDIIEDSGKSKEEIVESIEMIYADILTLNNQLSNILAAAEIEATVGLEKNPRNFDMTDLIDDIIQTQQSIFRDKNIQVSMNTHFSESIFNDREKFFLILRNLIENAFEFSPENSKIEIDGRIEDKNIVIFIMNIGNRIREEARMYDAFYQERSDFSRIHHGLGLGLAIVKHYINFLGGLVMYSYDNDLNIFRVSIPLEVDVKASDAQEIESFSFEDESNKGKAF